MFFHYRHALLIETNFIPNLIGIRENQKRSYSKQQPKFFNQNGHLHIKLKWAKNKSLYLGSIDQLISQTLSNSLDIPEGGFTCPGTQEPDGLVDTPQWRDVHSLTPDGTSTTNTSGVLTGATVDDGIHQNLERVLKRLNILSLVGIQSKNNVQDQQNFPLHNLQFFLTYSLYRYVLYSTLYFIFVLCDPNLLFINPIIMCINPIIMCINPIILCIDPITLCLYPVVLC